MKDLKRMLMTVLICCIVSAGAFAQDQNRDEQKRPRKDQEKVREVEKKGRPPNRGQEDEKKDEGRRKRP